MQIQTPLFTDSFERERDSGANIVSRRANGRPPLGSQRCDMLAEFSVCVRIAMQVLSQRLTDSVGRERDDGANIDIPRVNYRHPLGSQNCDTFDEFIVCVKIAVQAQSPLLTDSFDRGRDLGASIVIPRVNCRPALGSQKRDTLNGFTVCVRIAVRSQSTRLTVSFEQSAGRKSHCDNI